MPPLLRLYFWKKQLREPLQRSILRIELDRDYNLTRVVWQPPFWDCNQILTKLTFDSDLGLLNFVQFQIEKNAF